MIWNGKAVNRSSNCNPGSQPVWFEKSLLFGQRIGISNNRVLAQTRESRTVSAGVNRIIIRMSAIRKLAAEAADNGLLAPELAAGIARVKSAKSVGIRVGNWLSVRQAQSLLNAPDVSTMRGLRDRAILAILLGCGLRRNIKQNLREIWFEAKADRK